VAGVSGSQLVRYFYSAVDPSDVDRVRGLFLEDVRPAFDGLPGCLGIELLINITRNAGGLVDGMAMSRWESREAMDDALASRGVQEALVRITQFLRQEPITRTFEVMA
jgi:quinol monooxygenase YgiN